MSSDTDADDAIVVSDVSKTFRIFSDPRHRLLQGIFRGRRNFFVEKHALRDVSLRVRRGEIVGIIGANGAGKTTLLSIICGTATPTRGQVITHGRISSLLDLGAGFNPDMTGHENLFFVGAIRGFTRREVEARRGDIEAFADIGDAVNQEVKVYSTGMVMRLAFALSIHLDPEILVVDEALAVGDEAFQRKCYSRLRSLRESGATILFVSHSSPLIVELCDRAVLMDRGERLADGDPKTVVEHYQRLLYAPPEHAPGIRAQIAAGESPAALESAPATFAIAEDHFDPALASGPGPRFARQGACISQPVLLDDSGRQVNLIEARAPLRYRFNVEFSTGVRRARFGMLLKTVTGVELAGRETSDQFLDIHVGETVNVEFTFACGLNPGVYFLNAGVLGVIGEEETYLDRIIDAVQFRVLPNRHHQTGITDLGIEARLSTR